LFDAGKIKEDLNADRFCSVVKCGFKTGLTRGVFQLDGIHVRTDNITLGTPGAQPIQIQMKNQYMILTIGQFVFFEPGDSGSLVYKVDSSTCELECIGMAIGGNYPNFSSVVTPIKYVLEALGNPPPKLKQM
jgi:hypothetical protein